MEVDSAEALEPLEVDQHPACRAVDWAIGRKVVDCQAVFAFHPFPEDYRLPCLVLYPGLCFALCLLIVRSHSIALPLLPDRLV